MANSLLTIDMVTREALRVAHETSQFIKTTDRQYDSSFAQTGAKIGSTLNIRMPSKYSVLVVVLAVDRADKVQAVMKYAQCLARNHRRREN